MQQDINYQKAMTMLNHTLQEMKSELKEIEDMSLKGNKKKMAKHMRDIMEKVKKKVEKYEKTQNQKDFNNVCRELEALQPSFVLNYNEICYDNGLEMLNDTLIEMEQELSEIDSKMLPDTQKDKIKYMHEIYDQLSSSVDKFAHTHEHTDFQRTLTEMEKLKPEFTFNYKELSH